MKEFIFIMLIISTVLTVAGLERHANKCTPRKHNTKAQIVLDAYGKPWVKCGYCSKEEALESYLAKFKENK